MASEGVAQDHGLRACAQQPLGCVQSLWEVEASSQGPVLGGCQPTFWEQEGRPPELQTEVAGTPPFSAPAGSKGQAVGT